MSFDTKASAKRTAAMKTEDPYKDIDAGVTATDVDSIGSGRYDSAPGMFRGSAPEKPASAPRLISIDLDKPLIRERIDGHVVNPSGSTDDQGAPLFDQRVKPAWNEDMARADEGLSAGQANAKHDPEYYTKWREENKEMIARGEDPWKDFERRAKERREATLLGRMSKSLKGMGKKKNKGGEGTKDSKEDDGIIR